ncbi:hypothetical protein PI125_g11465 [Phytophthora idaei]|nr:hypothetical protein PI125_g11465 [Phytophthora idaei]KAG3151778.1 hypothetical protein PI126_g10840 [Phytophthora idaei]
MSGIDCDEEDAVALLLDFQKAYDSLSRQFLVEILRRHGYPTKFIQAIDFLHTGTTVRFIANGPKSGLVLVTSGIRQGCPLAPLLFILAPDPFYRQVDRDPDIRGISVHSAGSEFELRIGGYADDTASYLRSAQYVPRLLELAGTYGKASGLHINEAKTMVVALCPRGTADNNALPKSLQYQDTHAYGRYLGTQIGSTKKPAMTWKKAEAQLQTTLALAQQKTLTVDQRSLLATAIIIPKLTYRNIKNFVWHAQFSETVAGARTWLGCGSSRTSSKTQRDRCA